MKDYKKLLTLFIQTVTFLFAAFGGFLKKVAPPADVGAFYPVGIISFLALILLMIISALGQDKPGGKSKKPWLIAGVILFLVALPPSFIYPHLLGLYTFPQNRAIQERKISASDNYLTPDARRYKSAHSEAPPEELDQNFPDGGVWTKSGMQRAELDLLVCYAWLVLSISCAIFCLLEANMRSGKDSQAAVATGNHE
jgi:hypothetical protein